MREHYNVEVPLRKLCLLRIVSALAAFILLCGFGACAGASVGEKPNELGWQVGMGRRVITPGNAIWMAGYGRKRVAEGKVHELWVKALAIKSADGKRVVLATTDHMGMSKAIYEDLYEKVHQRFKLERSEFMLTFSHNHSGPCLREDLVDYYPSDEPQRQAVREYSDWMEGQVVEAVGEALTDWQPGQLLRGEGHCAFAVNRRENREAEVPKLLAEGKPLKGAVDHSVPVLAIKGQDGKLLGVLFGYACHPTTLFEERWCGDYPGFAQINLEAKLPGTAAMFFNACGADQDPFPRGKLEHCERYGKMLSDAVEAVLAKPMQPVSSGLRTEFEFVDLSYEEVVTREKLLPVASGESELHARWARRMLKQLDEGLAFPNSYPYPVQVWQIGRDLRLIALGGEAVVDYSLRFKREFPGTTWVCGYANDLVAYIPSRRVWNEGGYEGGPHLDEYGRPAWRWAGDVEDRIADAVHRLARKVAGAKERLTLTDPVVVSNQNLAPGQAVDLTLPALPARPGHLLVLQFQAVVTSAGPAGCNFNAVFRFNGQDLGRFTAAGSPRLLGRGAEFQLAGETRTLPVFNGARLMTMYAPSPEVGDSMTSDGLGATFVMEISDVARGVDGNALTIRCLAPGPQAGKHGQLFVSGMQVGWLPRSALPIAPRQAPERGRVNQAVSVGRVTIAQSRCGGFVVKAAEGPELIVETALAMQADAPAALIADDTPGVTAGTQVSSKQIGRSGFTVSAAWPGLKMERSLKVRGGLVCWTEDWTNTSTQPQGVPFRHRFFFRQGETRILAGGCSDLGTLVNSPSNPTLFLQTPAGAGWGVVCESDWLRLLSGYRSSGELGEVYTQWLALPPGGRIQFELTITPMAQVGYWSFINGLRRRWGMNSTTMARPLFLGYARAQGRTEDEILANSLGHLGPIYVAINPWQRLEPDAKVITTGKFPRLADEAPRAPGGSPDLDVEAFLTFAHRAPYWASTGKEVEALHRAAPNVKVIQMVHPSMECIYKPMQDRWPIAADGIKSIQGAVFEEGTYSKTWLGDMCASGWGVLYYVPRPGSKQLQALLAGVIRGLDQYHLDGIYSDEFSWAGLQRGYSRYDYSRSDGYSADLDETGKVLRFKSDNAHTTEAAQKAVIAEVRKRGGFFLGNGGNVLRSIFAQPIQRFVEGGNGPNYFPQGHLSAVPLLLGNMGREKDTSGVFDGVKTCLAHGSIYSPPAVNLLLKGDDNFVCKQYPITVQEIGPGWVVGRERIITTVSRSFSSPSKSRTIKLHTYDRNGTRLAGDAAVRAAGAQPLSLVVPDGGLVIAE